MTFPTQPDTLTSRWLSEAIGYTVSDFEVQYFSEGAGVIGLVTRIALTSDAPFRSLIAKFPSPAAENRAVAAAYNMYGREVTFYQSMAETLSLRTPDLYYANFDAGSQDFIILMEDLIDYRIGDQVVGCSLIEAKRTLAAVAEMHASIWEPNPSHGLMSHNNPAQVQGMQAGFAAGWPVVMDRFRDLIPDAALIAETKLPPAIPKLLESMCSAPVCLSHADMRLDNIFFGANDVCFVDWQSVCSSAPEQDVAYFLTQSVPVEVQADQDLIGFYHQELTQRGINYPKAQLLQRYKVSALYLLCYAVVISGTLDLGNERGHQLGRTLLGGSMRALDELAAFDLLK